MTRVHAVFGRPASALHPGDELDCEECVTALTCLAIPNRARPHTTYTHVRPGGWVAGCSCGWSREGSYVRSEMGARVARRLADAWALRHLHNPLAGTEDA